jgi:pimeloyl-ACP methyl ester carboxylesterase
MDGDFGLAATWRERVFRNGSRRVRLVEAGQGPPVVLLHGLGSFGAEMLDALWPAAPGWRLVAPDRPGYGGSDPLAGGDPGPDAQAAWLAEIFDILGIARPLVVAHSIGSAVALCTALRRPDRVGGLVLLGPFCRPTRPAWMPLLRLCAAPVVGGPFARHIVGPLAPLLVRRKLKALFAPEEVPEHFRNFPVRDLARPEALNAAAAELRAFNGSMVRRCLQLRRLRVPTIILAGEDDPIAQCARHAEWLARRVPSARLVRIDGAGHMPHHTRPHLVAAALAELSAMRPAAARETAGRRGRSPSAAARR